VDVPDVESDEGLKTVILKDPSRMKNQELNACLRLWQDRQKKSQPAFQFHHWWSEGQKEFVAAHGVEQFDNNEDDEGNLSMNQPDAGDGNGIVQREKLSKPGKNGRESARARQENTKGDKQNKKNKKGKASATQREQKKNRNKSTSHIGETKGEATVHCPTSNQVATELLMSDIGGATSIEEQTHVRILLSI
jgi:hypothetical protein